MKVSLITGLMVVLITLIFSVPAAYGLARLKFAGNSGIGIAIFLTYLDPVHHPLHPVLPVRRGPASWTTASGR